jgi:hypothetical protein
VIEGRARPSSWHVYEEPKAAHRARSGQPFFGAVVEQERAAGLMSDDHFTVRGRRIARPRLVCYADFSSTRKR